MQKNVIFCNVGIFYKKELSNLSLLNFFDRINAIQKDRTKVVRKVNDKRISVFKFEHHSNPNIRVVPIGKYRDDYNPFVVDDTKSADLTQIDKEVVEVNTVFYNESYKTLCISTNRLAPSYGTVEDYLNTFLPKDGDFKVEIQPIIVSKGMERVRKSKQIKDISINLNLKSNIQSFILNTSDQNVDIFRAFASDLKSKYNANTLSIDFGIGTSKKQSMDIDSVLFLLDMLNLNADMIKEICVTYVDSSKEKVDYARLKDSKVELKGQYSFNGSSVAPEFLANNLDSVFDVNKNFILTALRKFSNEICTAPSEYNFIEVFEE